MIITALVQTGLYIDFFYVYYQYVFTNKESGVNLERENLKNVEQLKEQNPFDFSGFTKHV